MLSREQTLEFYEELLHTAEKKGQTKEVMCHLCMTDLFFLLTQVCKREDINRDWIYDRIREVEASPNGHIDLWAREHYKSTIITFGLTIQDILRDPNTTVGIFSHTKPIAKGFLRQIRDEFENNSLLKNLFPDILWDNPKRDAPRWSEDSGLVLKRTSNPKEATVEAHGLIDGQPTSRHYSLMIYDDVVTRESVTTPEMIKKTTEAWELSRNLSSEHGVTRYIGTRYHYNDTYKTIIDRGAAKPRLHPGTKDGKIDGEPVLWTQEYNDRRRKELGAYTYACQILQDPKADTAQGFQQAWLRFWPATQSTHLNLYILVDPANDKKKKSDYTAMFVVGIGTDHNYYVVDMVRDRLNLTERTKTLLALHRKYKPLKVGYEKYGKDTDIEHIEYVMDREQYRFTIVPLGGIVSKEDRIRNLIPVFENGRIYFPDTCFQTNYEKKTEDLTKIFVNDEYLAFPFSIHDDMLDCLARITDPNFSMHPPRRRNRSKKRQAATYYDPFTHGRD